MNYSSGECVHLDTSVERGKIGRPVLNIPQEMLEYYVDAGLSQKDMASLFGISKRTLNRRLTEFGISMSSKFSNLTNVFPNIGNRTGFVVQKSRVLDSMKRVEIEGVLQGKMLLKPILRRQYNVRAPLSLWHMDGYHKLIRIERLWRDVRDPYRFILQAVLYDGRYWYIAPTKR
ncbi:hypothetical protein MAR_013734 [Mya arenaria]|uniref:Uncharacterized protein n=1 Tax=Mya arenaria TaxID=6604 RepID=A0ABY7G0P9_MYAAR|nr:hypothetical protein MAR_013734 [Mya arenaria]